MEIFLWLTQAPNTSMQISRNIGAMYKGFFYIKNALQSKNVIALNFYIDINELVYERRLMMTVFSMTKFLC